MLFIVIIDEEEIHEQQVEGQRKGCAPENLVAMALENAGYASAEVTLAAA
jgi:hypothetical protein